MARAPPPPPRLDVRDRRAFNYLPCQPALQRLPPAFPSTPPFSCITPFWDRARHRFWDVAGRHDSYLPFSPSGTLVVVPALLRAWVHAYLSPSVCDANNAVMAFVCYRQRSGDGARTPRVHRCLKAYEHALLPSTHYRHSGRAAYQVDAGHRTRRVRRRTHLPTTTPLPRCGGLRRGTLSLRRPFTRLV